MGISSGQLIIMIMIPVFIWANVRVLHKSGRSGWWALLLLIPFIYFIMIWVFSFTRWPKVDDAAKPDANVS